MKRLSMLCALLVVAMSASAQYLPSSATEPSVDVAGYASREVMPDKFVITITTQERENRGKQSLQEQEREIFKVLQQVGIDAKTALKLKNNYSSNQRRSTAQEFRVYELTLSGSETLNKAFAALDTLNLWSVELSSAVCSRVDEIRRELRAEAMRDAKQRAGDLAGAIDQQIGECIYIQDESSGGDVRFYAQKASAVREESNEDIADALPEPSVVEFRSQTISHRVTARFRLLK